MRCYYHDQNVRGIWRGTRGCQDTLNLRKQDLKWTWVRDTRGLQGGHGL